MSLLPSLPQLVSIVQKKKHQCCFSVAVCLQVSQPQDEPPLSVKVNPLSAYIVSQTPLTR